MSRSLVTRKNPLYQGATNLGRPDLAEAVFKLRSIQP